MCGLTGLLAEPGRLDREALAARARAMAATLRHRGPDAEGVWVDERAGVALGHRRLAVLDLSEAGAQPMVSPDGALVLAYNGEVYNFAELRRELERRGHPFAGHGDTEVVLAACREWGIEAALGRFVGMFALALWDRERRVLSLARDRLGIKPLYWGRVDGLVLFASELKALRALGDWRPEVDRDVLAAYLRHDYVPGPHCIYRGLGQLEPGTVVEVARAGEPRARRYWSLAEVAGRSRPRTDPREAEERLEACLREAVRCRLVSDVPVGAFLSGGVDSSTVVALMQRELGTPVRTFTIGFRERGYDEAAHARAVAAHLGTEHCERYLSPAETREVIPALPDLYDEPFADVSQIPTYLVSRVAREAVTVSLSGDGGDELFAGYNRYLWGRRVLRVLGLVPRRGWPLAAALLRAPRPEAWDRLARLIPARLRPRLLSDKLAKVADLLESRDPAGVYRYLVSFWSDPERVVLGAREARAPWWGEALEGGRGLIPAMQRLDTLTYLPDDILTKVDRASMAVSLEARVPLLDHRVVECAWSLPLEMKLRGATTKWALRRILYRHVPRELIERPKMGFGVPIDAWLRGPLRDWAEGLLDEARLRREGFLDPAPVRERWAEHLAGRRNWQYALWGVLMFEAWLERWG